MAMAEHAGEGASVAAPIARAVYEAYFKTAWAPHVATDHQTCTEHEYLCPALWPRVPSSISGITYRST